MLEFRRAVEAHDLEAVVGTLAEEVVFRSPVVHQPYRGREQVGMLLKLVDTVFEDFRYVAELAGDGQVALVFKARVGDRELDGIDLLRLDAAGKVAELTVFVRPRSGLEALRAQMMARLEKLGAG